MSVPRWDGADYQARFDALAATGEDVHGEVGFVLSFSPSRVLDAGCGTGRVAIELGRHGIEVVGVDVDPSMLATARARAPSLRFDEADLTAPDFHLGLSFDLVVMAGNVPLFTPVGTQAALVAGCARHLEPGGHLVAGFSLDRGYGLDDYDADCAAAGLGLAGRWATWDRQPLGPTPAYAVSVHRGES
ncbi:MAG: class I SAM-dependent methyltransferase [Acidimicrobiales bacterium]